MTRLPINFLLYLCSGALALGSGWTFYTTMTQSNAMDPSKIAEVSSAHIQKGREQDPDDVRDTYAGAAEEWWKQFGRANLTGEERAEPDETTKVEEVPEPTVTLTPVADILDVVGLAFDSTGTSRCVVRYKSNADVHPPAERSASEMDAAMAAAARSATGGTAGTAGYGGPLDTAVPGQRPVKAAPAQPLNQPLNQAANQSANQPGTQPGAQRGAAPGMPSYTEQQVFQVLAVGDSLWPNYSDIKLARVQEDGMAVFFSRKRPGQEEPVEEKIFPDEFGLDQAVITALAGAAAPVPSRPGPKPVKPEAQGDWVDVAETRAVRPGQWHISRDDDQFLRDNAQDVFNRDVAVRSYQSSTGNVRGVQITNVSPRLERFGIRPGDVLIELNGFKVTNKAQALKIGKDLYKQGVRTFQAKILTGYGRIEERTYHAPDE